jgi:biotin transport system substrate-specific component
VTAVLPARRSIVLADLLPGALARDLLLVGAAALFVGITAQLSLRLPGTPVPVTGQTLGVLLSGAALGWRRATGALALYLVAGLAGVPWFAGQTSGIDPSFGYVVGFLVAAPVLGVLARNGADRTPLRMLGGMVIGNAVIYLFGVGFLAIDLRLGARTAIDEGLRPFVLGDLIKAVIAAVLLPSTWAAINRSAR